ncbi:DUF368 domain-containing protein [Mycoplasma sp. P36-A1]|uniref:DUF368 domain-containing protein n=1 Tax=Mycoplasma sp. P36-A1 TaxID=3252900 RepID=UPI003C2B8F6D
MKYQKSDMMTTITGFLMAIADSVPGVSGGTIAYVMGKYEDFVNAISSMSSKANKEDRKKGIEFLIKLLMGWIVGMGLAITIVSTQVTHKPYEMTSLFLGFVIVSIPFIVKEEKLMSKISLKGILLTIIGILFVYLVSSSTAGAVNLGEEGSIVKYLYIFVAGMVAICAMVLPGISGSTFLLIFGLYVPIITAVKNVMKFNFESLDICIVFGLGVLIGLFYFSKLVKYLLNNYRSLSVFFVVGLMIGSIYAICIGPTSLTDEITKQSLNLAPLGLSNFKVIWFVVGIIFILALEQLKHKMEGNKNE